MNQKYNEEGDILEIKKFSNDKIKIIGYSCREVSRDFKQIFDKVVSYNFPEYWEDLECLLTGENYLIIKSLEKDSVEWETIQQKFNKSLPAA